MSFKSGVKGRGSDRWWERSWCLWWNDMRKTFSRRFCMTFHLSWVTVAF